MIASMSMTSMCMFNMSPFSHFQFAKYRDKEKILKATRQKKSLTYKGRQIRLADLSIET